MRWLLKRLLCCVGIHFHSRRGRYLCGYYIDSSWHWWPEPQKVADDATHLQHSAGGLAMPLLADICPVCGHRRMV